MTLSETRNLLALQARVIGALVLREASATFGSSKAGYLWAVITPSASIGLLVAVFTLAGRHAAFGSNLAVFFATGIFTLQLFTKLSNMLMATLEANKALLKYPVIKATDTLFARTILVSATYLVVMTLFFMTLIVLGFASAPSFPEILTQAFIATVLLGFGFGTVNALIVTFWVSWSNIEKILTRPLFFLSGIFYVPSKMPPEAVYFLKWNPVLHLIEWMREGYYPNYNSSILDRSYPLTIAMILILVGLSGERFFRKYRV